MFPADQKAHPPSVQALTLFLLNDSIIEHPRVHNKDNKASEASGDEVCSRSPLLPSGAAGAGHIFFVFFFCLVWKSRRRELLQQADELSLRALATAIGLTHLSSRPMLLLLPP